MSSELKPATLTAPERIFLQICDDVDCEQTFSQHEDAAGLEGVTWCQDSINENDVAYVRADLAESSTTSLKAEVESLRGVLRDLMRGYTNTLETGRDRALFLGGDCDSLDLMVESDPHLRAARAVLKEKP